MDENFKIERTKLLAVEGKDEINFFEALLRYEKIEDVQYCNIGGKDKFKHELPLLIGMEKFSELKTIGFVRDAENLTAENAFKSICNILISNGLHKPDSINVFKEKNNLKIGVFIMPNNKDSGMLETLCIESIKSDKNYNCIEKYIDCIRSSQTVEEKEKFNQDKSGVLTYLASKIPVEYSLGIASKKGYFNFSHDCFDEIKKFLANFKE